MSSLTDFDVEMLVTPLAGADPAGIPLPFDVREQLDKGRKIDPFEPSSKPDWPKLERLAKDTLTNTSKDLLVAVRLVEAITVLHGFAGLNAGLELLTRLIDECWERLHPVPEPGDDWEVRINQLEWLNKATQGGQFPQTLNSLPLLQWERDQAWSRFDWQNPTRRAELETTLSAWDRVKRPEPVLKLRQTFAEIVEAEKRLAQLSKVVDQRLPEAGLNLLTGTGTLGGELEGCKLALEGMANKFKIALTETQAPATTQTTGTTATSADALRQNRRRARTDRVRCETAFWWSGDFVVRTFGSPDRKGE